MSLPKDPRVVVTGAGGGLGRALCLAVARRGARLIASDLDVDAAEETCRLARDAGAGDARAIRCDVTNVDDVEALAAEADRAYGGTDLLANNAGVGAGGCVGEISLADWKFTLDVDLWGVIHGCHVFVPRMKKQRKGHILNVASAAGLLCSPRMAPYNVAKAGVVALSETLAAELSGHAVGVTVLCPTFFRTNIIRNGRFTNPKLREIGEGLLARSKMSADDVARFALDKADRNELYAVPMADGRWMWRLKRAAPGAFQRIARGIEVRMGRAADR